MNLLCMLTDVSFPAVTHSFFQGAILFAGMDIFSGEDFYEKNLVFQETQPINIRFEEMGVGDKNFMMNSGSYLIMQLFAFLWFYGKQILIRICVKFSSYGIFRKIGMYLGEYNPRGLRQATLRLFLESYFDISIACFANVMAFMERESLLEMAVFFSTPADILNSIITLVVLIGIIVFPMWMFYKIYSNRNDLEHPDFQKEFDWLFEDLRATSLDAALY